MQVASVSNGALQMIRVFIADDSPVVCERLMNMLSEIKGIEVVGQAGTVPDAIESIKTLQPDVVILDIRMPGGSGIDVLRKVKQGENVPTVIILTNYPYPQYRRKCMEAKADFFLDKSTEFQSISEVFKGCVKGSLSESF